MSETKSSSQAGNQVQMPSPPKEVMQSVRASKPGKPYSGSPGHKMPR